MNSKKSDKFLETATKMLAKEIMRFGDDISYDDSMLLSEEIVANIDWDNEALMHKGYSWIAKNYMNRCV